MAKWLAGAGLAAIAGWPGAAYAGDKPLYQPAPAWVKPAPAIEASALADGAPALVRLDSQQRLEDGRVWAYFDTATRVASAEQLSQVGDVQLQWQPTQGDLVIHTAEIIRGNQHIDLVKNGAVPFTVLRRETQLDQRMLDGLLTGSMAAEGLAVGDVLHLVFSITRKDPTLKGDMQMIAPLIADPMRAGFARVRLSWPEKTDVRWKAYVDGVVAKPSAAGGFREIEFALPLPKQPEIPDDAPARFRKLPILEATSFADWSAVAKAMAPLYATDGLIAPGSPLAAEVTTIKAAESDPVKRAALALQLVQDKVRYLLLGMDTGNYVPQTPADTWSKRFGDCKAKTLLLLSVLRALDIEAEPVAANLQLGEYVPQRLPSLAAFNHVLVRATIAGKTYWLDGTGSGSRLADMGDSPRLGSVLPLRAAGATLMPVVLHADARPDAIIAVDIDDSAGVDLPSLAKAQMTIRGAGAEALATAAAQATPDQRRQIVQRLMVGQVGNGTWIDPVISYDRAAGIMTVTAQGLMYTRWSRNDRRYRMVLDSAVGKLSFDPDRARSAWSAIPVSLPGPSSVVYRTTVHLPAGGKDFTLDGDRTLPASLAGTQLSRTLAMTGGVITIEDHVDQLGGELAPADIPTARAAMAQAKARLATVLAPASMQGETADYDAARRAGLYKPIDAMFTRVIAADKDDAAGNYQWRARVRAAAADRTGAIADYTSAIALEPTSERYLARAEMYDALGQDARQLADLEAARKLSPDTDDVVEALATYQARHGAGAAAVALIDAKLNGVSSKDRPRWLADKAEAQADAGQRDTALATLDQALAEKPSNPTLLNSRCWTRGTGNVTLDGALKDCTKAIELDDNAAAALDSRAMVYFRMGRFDDALADLASALDAAPDTSGSLFMRGIVLRRMGKSADGDASLARARLADPRVDKRYARWGIMP